jgi:hypothetical protein
MSGHTYVTLASQTFMFSLPIEDYRRLPFFVVAFLTPSP